MAGSGASERGRVAARSESREEAARVLPSKKSLFSALSNASRSVAADAGVSRRQVRHSGPAAGGSLPLIAHVPSSQQAILTAHRQPWRAVYPAARGSTAAAVKKASRHAAKTGFSPCTFDAF